jgi:hypothetical protein
VAFLIDITGHLNVLNLKLQGKEQVFILLYDFIKAFKAKHRLWEGQLDSGYLTHLPTYQDYQTVTLISVSIFSS